MHHVYNYVLIPIMNSLIVLSCSSCFYDDFLGGAVLVAELTDEI